MRPYCDDVRLTMGSLFAGIGGFDLGFERAGFETRWQVEWDQHASGVLARHWPDVARYGDIREVSGHELEPVDVITFGSPCQDLSVAGKRAGLDGNRSSMFFEALRVFREMRDVTNGRSPALVVWENVPGVFSSNSGRDFAHVLAGLAELGAVDIAWRVLDAQFFGVAQRRRRLFVVADFGGERAAAVLFEPESVRGNPPARRASWQGVARAIAPCLAASGRGVARPGYTRGEDPLVVVAASDGVTQAPHSVASTVTTKWARGSGGLAGNEVQNLVPVHIPETIGTHSRRTSWRVEWPRG